MKRTSNWDLYFRNICEAVASNSKCLSRQVGAILVKDKSVLATGYNGPPRGVPECGEERWGLDDSIFTPFISTEDIRTKCPRRLAGAKSGENLHLCIAAHAETNCIANAARHGVEIYDTAMYMNCVIACSECLKLMINAGIDLLTCDSLDVYDNTSIYLLKNSDIRVRTFDNEWLNKDNIRRKG